MPFRPDDGVDLFVSASFGSSKPFGSDCRGIDCGGYVQTAEESAGRAVSRHGTERADERTVELLGKKGMEGSEGVVEQKFAAQFLEFARRSTSRERVRSGGSQCLEI